MPTNCSNSQNCWFTFISEAESPSLANISSTAMTTGSLSFTGLRFGNQVQASFTNKITGKVTVVTPITPNNTDFTITLPPL
jgi:hypothetical protein